MIFTKSLCYEDIKKQLDMDDVITLIACSSCARVAGTGSNDQMRKLAGELRRDGFEVIDGYSINTVCTPKVFQAKLPRGVNTIITMACSAGFTNVNRIYPDMKVINSCLDIGLMEANTKEGTVKINMAYEGYEDKEGSLYQIYTGEELNTSFAAEREGVLV